MQAAGGRRRRKLMPNFLGAESRGAPGSPRLKACPRRGGPGRTAINPRLVRGLDYYNLTVFEWITDQLGSQGTVCGGGRYDGLFEQLGGKPTPAIGFGLGIERLLLLLQELGAAGAPDQAPDALRHPR